MGQDIVRVKEAPPLTVPTVQPNTSLHYYNVMHVPYFFCLTSKLASTLHGCRQAEFLKMCLLFQKQQRNAIHT